MNKIDQAYAFYCEHIYDQEKIQLLRDHNLKIAGSVPAVLWELFGALLTGCSGAGNTGADLQGWEVKSAANRGSYEYQYHLNTGEQKLHEDCRVNHLFCSYSETYKDVSVRAISGSELAVQFFQLWLPEYRENYDTSAPANQRRQRFRKNIPAGYVAAHGAKILEINDGIIVARHDDVLDQFNGG